MKHVIRTVSGLLFLSLCFFVIWTGPSGQNTLPMPSESRFFWKQVTESVAGSKGSFDEEARQVRPYGRQAVYHSLSRFRGQKVSSDMPRLQTNRRSPTPRGPRGVQAWTQYDDQMEMRLVRAQGVSPKA